MQTAKFIRCIIIGTIHYYEVHCSRLCLHGTQFRDNSNVFKYMYLSQYPTEVLLTTNDDDHSTQINLLKTALATEMQLLLTCEAILAYIYSV